MDEFDKIRELTEDLTNRKEPSFTGFNFSKEPSFQNQLQIQALTSQNLVLPYMQLWKLWFLIFSLIVPLCQA